MEAGKYRKRPVIIEALQWTGDNIDDISRYTNKAASWNAKDPTKLDVRTLEGWLSAGLNDWIIRGVKGEFYPCRDDIFRETYEEA